MNVRLPDGRCPSDRMTTPSSAIVMVPSSSLSKSMNASLNSETTSCSFWETNELPITPIYTTNNRFPFYFVRTMIREKPSILSVSCEKINSYALRYDAESTREIKYHHLDVLYLLFNKIEPDQIESNTIRVSFLFFHRFRDWNAPVGFALVSTKIIPLSLSVPLSLLLCFRCGDFCRNSTGRPTEP